VTYAAVGSAYSVDITPREVLFATDGGLWHFDRYTGKPLYPEFSGRAGVKFVSLAGARGVLYHHETGTVWLLARTGLFYRAEGLDEWREVQFDQRAATVLGERGDTLFLRAGDRVEGILPFGRVKLGRLKVGLEGVRWTSWIRTEKIEYPFYGANNAYLRFEPSDGRLVDWFGKTYHVNYCLVDDRYFRRYLCYDDLGIAVGNERGGSLDIYRPGPSKGGVTSIAFGSNGKMFTAGSGSFSYFDRQTGLWEHESERPSWDLNSQTASDMLFEKGKLYVATDQGLMIGTSGENLWSSSGLLESGARPPIRTLEIVGRWLFLGGDRDIRRMALPGGPFFRIDAPEPAKSRIADAASDGDTLWIAGVGGIYRGTIEGRMEYLGGDEVIGDEATRAIAVSKRFVAAGGSGGLRYLNRSNGDWNALKNDVFFGGGQVVSLAVQENYFWIGTTNGLFKYDVDFGRLVSMGVAEGLPATRVNRLVIEADTLWVGTAAGLTRIDTNALFWK
jgi:hypothetical protein